MSSIAPSNPVTEPPAPATMSGVAFGAWMGGLALYAVFAVLAVGFTARYNANLALQSGAVVPTAGGMAAQLTVEFKAIPDGDPSQVQLELRTGGPGNFQFERYDWSQLALMDADPQTVPSIPPQPGLVTTFVIPLTPAQAMAAAGAGAEAAKVFVHWGYSHSLRAEL